MEEFIGEFTLEHDENGHGYIACDEDTAEFFEAAFIDWCHRGYMEPKRITLEGRVTWKLTPWGKEHVADIIKVRNEE